MDATPEEWRPVVGCEGRYEVSDAGRVRTLPRITTTKSGWTRTSSYSPRLLKPKVEGYSSVTLYGPHGRRYCDVHTLVLESFVGLRPAGMVACHANDVKCDNRLVNLRWDTPSANTNDAVANGCHPRTKKTHCIHGHEFTAANTRIYQSKTGRTWRYCRQCHRLRKQRGLS